MSDVPALRVLVVEDEFIIADEIASIVEGAGHTVVGPIGSVAEALATVERAAPDFAIIDASLRGDSSAPLGARLSTLGVPFCVCTGYRIDDLRPSFGDVTVVAKPVRARTLIDILDAAARAAADRPPGADRLR